MTTAIYPVDREVDYTIVGLGSEIGELAEVYADAKKGYFGKLDGTSTVDALGECGDIFWYVAATADALKVQLDWVLKQTSTELHHASKGLTLVDMMIAHGRIQGVLKKSIRDNDGFLAAKAEEVIVHELAHIWNHTAQFIYMLGGTENGVMSANLNKLADRKTRGVLQGSGSNR